MKKLLVTLDINYDKEITKITFPYMKEYAEKIGADFYIITKRKFPNLDINLEKFQLYDICENYDWTIFLDADCLIDPNGKDLTELVENDRIIVPSYNNPEHHFYSKNIEGKYNFNFYAPLFVLVFHKNSRNCLKPYKNPLEYCRYIKIDNTNKEMIKYLTSKKIDNQLIPKSWFLDEFLFNLNLHKYKIKTASIRDNFPQINIIAHTFFDKKFKIQFLNNSIKRLTNNNIWYS